MEKWTRVKFQPNLPLGENGERLTGSLGHIGLSKEAAKEGMVLLKNRGDILPLKKGTRVALFGKAAFDYVKGGGGSGDVTVAYIRNLYEGLKMQKDVVSIFEPLCDYYRKDVERQYAQGSVPGMTIEPEVPQELLNEAKAYADTAVISICRFSGEGWDRKSIVDTDNKNMGEGELDMAVRSSKIFANGDFCLSAQEAAMVETVKKNFSKVVVVMNVGGMVDTSWFVREDAIGAVLMAWQGGMEGGLAAAELLAGKGNPSGKLSDTFAQTLEDYPSTGDFHESRDYVNYTEDIYVGYRYFETVPGADQKVNYPFGFGLSYTTFQTDVLSAEEKEGQVRIQVEITNTGSRDGKEVVQVYFEAPQGRLGKPKRQLIAFAKTRSLRPGESQRLYLSFEIRDMASYDDTGKVQKAAYVLEKGDYFFHVGTSVRDTVRLDYVYQVKGDTVTEQLESRLTPSELPRRMLSDGSYEEVPQREGNDPNANELERMPEDMMEGYVPAVRPRDRYQLWREPYKKGTHIFKEVAEGKLTPEEFLAQLTDEETAQLLGGQPNTGVANTFGYGNLPEYGVPSVMTADGPAGLRIAPECGVTTTCWPCSTLLACSWNPEIVEAVGLAGGAEVKENNIAVWLTPAVNIHRSPLCGRNFEYYSEDPYLAGKLASAMVRGIQANHIGATVKHFALNNKETNRKNSDSRVSERAAREIYLKAFEIIVREAKPWSIMTSYNIINGHRASENADLLEGILRGEWGFDGCITTDWWTCGEHYKEVKAGNDIKMGCGYPERLLEALEKGCLTRKEMDACALRVLKLILKID
ncbi:MAG: beta-glucosidase [Lachnospiraceae bacterium]|nr:beta-glucosidase [Lachnospiraceae bacterium]